MLVAIRVSSLIIIVWLDDEVQGMQAIIVEVIGQMVREAVLQAIKEVCNLWKEAMKQAIKGLKLSMDNNEENEQ